MFSKKQHSQASTSRTAVNKRLHAELDAFTPDELTGGLNRMSVNRYQKLARKSAQGFVKSEPSLSTPLTSMQQHGESIRFMDFLVQTTVDKHSRNAEVQELARAYRDAPQTPSAKAAAFAQFEKESQPWIEQQQKVNAGIEMGYSTSNICSQVALLTKNKELGRFATGIGAMTQAVDSFNKISQAAKMMGAAESFSGAMVSGGVDMLGGIGMALGVVNMIASLSADEPEDSGLGNALAAIHSAVMAMWEDTRRNFAIVFEKLDILDEKITEMERQNWKRFVASMRAIHHYSESTRVQLIDLKTTVQGGLNDSHQRLESYMQTFARSDSREVVAFIRKVGQAKDIETLANHSNKLEEWLTQRAATSGYSGRIPTRHGKLNIETQALITRLEHATAQEVVSKGSFPLGLYASLAQSIDSRILWGENIEAMVNPQDWSQVLASYIEVIQAGVSLISDATLGQQKAFVNEASTIKQVPLLVLNLLSGIRDSDKLWTKLIQDYQEAVIGIQTKISNVIEKQRQTLNTAYDIEPALDVLRLEETMRQNFRRINKTQVHQKLRIKDPIAWLQTLNARYDAEYGRPSLVWGTIYNGKGICYTGAELGTLSVTQARLLFEKDEHFKTVISEANFLVGKAYGVMDVDVSCYCQNMEPHKPQYYDGNTRGDFIFSFRTKQMKEPFIHLNLYVNHNSNYFSDFRHFDRESGSYYTEWGPTAQARRMEVTQKNIMSRSCITRAQDSLNQDVLCKPT